MQLWNLKSSTCFLFDHCRILITYYFWYLNEATAESCSFTFPSFKMILWFASVSCTEFCIFISVSKPWFRLQRRFKRARLKEANLHFIIFSDVIIIFNELLQSCFYVEKMYETETKNVGTLKLKFITHHLNILRSVLWWTSSSSPYSTLAIVVIFNINSIHHKNRVSCLSIVKIKWVVSKMVAGSIASNYDTSVAYRGKFWW